MALGVAVFGALAWAEFRGTRELVQSWAAPYHPDPKSIPECIRELGGPERAARRLDLYLRLCNEQAPQKWAAVRLLGGCGRAAARPLGRLLADEDLRGSASYHLERLGRDAEEAGDRVIALLPESKDGVRLHMIMVLLNVRIDHPRAVEALVAATRDPDELNRCEALRALGSLGRGDPAALRRLVSALESRDRDERLAAARGLADLRPKDAETARVLAAALRAALKRPHQKLDGGNLIEVLEVIDAIGSMGSAARPAGNALKEAGNDTNSLVRTGAARVLEFRRRREADWTGSAAEKLKRRVDFEFVEVPFGDVLEYFEYLGKVRIILDPRASGPSSPRGPITLRMTQAPLKLGLAWAIKLAGLDYEVRGNYVFVSHCG
jgi:hypothetical protein